MARSRLLARARPRRRARRRRLLARLARSRPDQSARLVLDFQPNAVHAGIYLALERDFDGAEGVDLSVAAPSSSTDSVKLLLGGRAQFAILDIHDLALAREKGRDIVGVMAVVQRPLAAVIAQPQIARPRDLEGKRVGVTGLPSDDAVLSSIVRGDGGDPAKVHKVTIGFQAVTALLARPGRRGHGVLERRGRGAAGQAPGHAPVQGRRLRRPALPRARAVREPRRRCDDDRALVARHRPRAAPRLRGDDQRPGVGRRGARRSRARRPRRHRARARRRLAGLHRGRHALRRARSQGARGPGRAGRRASASPSARPTSRAPSPPASSSGAARGRRRPCRRRAGAARAPRRGRRAAASRPRCARRALRAPAPSARW